MSRPEYRGFRSDHLRVQREQRGWTQEQLAVRVRALPVMVGKWERGEATPRPDRVRALEELFGLPVRSLTSTPVTEASVVDLRVWCGQTRPEVAQFVEMAERRLFAIEHHVVRPAPAEAARLAAAYEVTPTVLLDCWDQGRRVSYPDVPVTA